MSKLILLLCTLFLAWGMSGMSGTSNAWAATYYVSPSGSNSNDGSEGSPWLTLQHAAETAVAGDTVYARGGTYNDGINFDTANEGNATNGHITFQNYPGETPSLTGGGYRMWFHIYGKSYIKIIGFHLHDYDGGGFDVQGSPGGTIGPTRVEIRNNTIQNQNSLTSPYPHAINFAAICFPNVCPMGELVADGNTLIDIESGVGDLFNEALTIGWGGDGFRITNNTLDTIKQIGINNIGHTVQLANEWFGQWGGGAPPGSEPWPHRGYIAHNLVKNGYNGDTAMPCAAIYFDGGRETVLEHNRVEDWAVYGISISTEEENFSPKEVVVRFNTIRNTWEGLYCGQNDPGPSQMRCAHNTVYLATSPWAQSSASGNAYGDDIVRKNNLFHVPMVGAFHVEHVTASTAIATVDYNLYYPPDRNFEFEPPDCPECPRKIYSNFSAYQTAITSLSGYPQEANSRTGNPLMTNPGAGDFTLQPGSDAMNTGTVLTTATNASGGGGSTTLTVQDAAWFSDGRNVFGGDVIQIAGSGTAVVTGINYTTNTLTLNVPRVWSVGTGVSYPWAESAPDIGAFEAGETGGGGGVTPVLGTFYIDDTGTDAVDCTAAQNIATPRRKWANISPCHLGGSTIYWRAGTYAEDIETTVLPIVGGAAGAYTVLSAYPGAAPFETVTLNRVSGYAPFLLNNGANDHHIELRGFVIDTGATAGTYGVIVWPAAHHIRLQALEVRNTGVQNVVLYGANNLEVLQSILHGNTSGTSVLEMNETTTVVARQNTIYGGSARGVQMMGGATGVDLSRNVIHTNAGVGIEVGQSSQVLMANNRIYDNLRGMDILTGSTNPKIYYNDFFSNTGVAVQVDSGASGTALTNNTYSADGGTVSDAGTGTSQTTNSANPAYTAPGPPTVWNKAGILATDVPEVTTDFNGVARPAGASSRGTTQESLIPSGPVIPTMVPPYRTTGFFGGRR